MACVKYNSMRGLINKQTKLFPVAFTIMTNHQELDKKSQTDFTISNLIKM